MVAGSAGETVKDIVAIQVESSGFAQIIDAVDPIKARAMSERITEVMNSQPSSKKKIGFVSQRGLLSLFSRPFRRFRHWLSTRIEPF